MAIKFEQKNPNDSEMTITSEKRLFIWRCAMKDIMLDGTFSDEECNLWSLFRLAYDIGTGECTVI